MSDSTIRVGDRVMLVYACCEPGIRCIGQTGDVFELRVLPTMNIIGCCGMRIESQTWAAVVMEGKPGTVPVAWLKKLPAESEPERIEKDEAITA